jgi:UDP-glucose 4-epimerase
VKELTMRDFLGCQALVVGGAGFVGSNLVQGLLGAGADRVLVVDNLLSSEATNLPVDYRVELVAKSITDDWVLADLDDSFDYVFHLATFHGNQSSIARPLQDHQNNTLTSLKLFERLSRFRRLRKVVYSSAGCTVAEKTYGDATPTKESDPVGLYLDSPYQMSKIFGEFYANYYFTQFGLPVVKARFQNVYGPGEILGAGDWRGTPATVWRNVVPTFIYRALKGLPLVVENGGVATRDFIYVSDICRGLMMCAAGGSPGEVYNLASGTETSIAELAALIIELAGSDATVQSGEKRWWDRSGKRLGCTQKSTRDLGFTSAVPLREGLQTTVAWTIDVMPRIDACIGKHAGKMAQPTGSGPEG